MTSFAEKLIAPDGRVFTARSAAEYNDLRYGQGYRPAPATEPAPAPLSEPQRPTVRAPKPKATAETDDN
jgi:hypothetical protein